MTYVVSVPIETEAPVSEADPDVRFISRLPGFIALEQLPNGGRHYELRFEVEGGSVQDATDAADELIAEYENALYAYRPKPLEPVVPQKR